MTSMALSLRRVPYFCSVDKSSQGLHQFFWRSPNSAFCFWIHVWIFEAMKGFGKLRGVLQSPNNPMKQINKSHYQHLICMSIPCGSSKEFLYVGPVSEFGIYSLKEKEKKKLVEWVHSSLTEFVYGKVTKCRVKRTDFEDRL